MKRVLLFCLGMMILVSALSGQAKVPAPKDQLYIEVSALGNLAYFYDHKMGMEMVGKELGVRTEYVGPADYDMNAMVAAFEQAIAKKPQGIVVVGFEDSLNPIIDKAISKGIGVVTVDADLPKSKRLAFVGTGNYGAGVMGGQKLAQLIGGKGKVAIIMWPGQSNLEERLAGYKAALAPFKDIQIVQVISSGASPDASAANAAIILQKFPDLAGFGCIDSTGGAGATMAVREAKLAGKVKIVAMDRDNDLLDGIGKGIVTASVVQQTALMPYWAVHILYDHVNSKVNITSNDKAAGVSGIPAVVDTGVVIVDSSNYMLFKR